MSIIIGTKCLLTSELHFTQPVCSTVKTKWFTRRWSVLLAFNRESMNIQYRFVATFTIPGLLSAVFASGRFLELSRICSQMMLLIVDVPDRSSLFTSSLVSVTYLLYRRGMHIGSFAVARWTSRVDFNSLLVKLSLTSHIVRVYTEIATSVWTGILPVFGILFLCVRSSLDYCGVRTFSLLLMGVCGIWMW